MIISTVTGRLCADAELRTVGSDYLLTFTLASDNKPKNVNGEPQKSTTFVNGKIWGKRAQTVQQYFTKGKKIMASGELENRKWTSADKSGESLDLSVNTFEFLESNKSQISDDEVHEAYSDVSTVAKSNYSKPSTTATSKLSAPPSGGSSTIKPLVAVAASVVEVSDPFNFD